MVVMPINLGDLWEIVSRKLCERKCWHSDRAGATSLSLQRLTSLGKSLIMLTPGIEVVPRRAERPIACLA